MRGLYIHIPFCKSKCYYCDFNSIIDNAIQDEYIKALIQEIELYKEIKFDTIFIGGGTPTILSINNLKKLLLTIKNFYPKEFTIECNPGTLSQEKLKLLKEFGINRLSIGLQSIDNNILKSIGRIHTFEEFLQNYYWARQLGFKNINIDIMYNLPNQSAKEFMNGLQTVLELKPEHISCYSLIIEEETKFWELYNQNKLNLLDEDEERYIYKKINQLLNKYGYYQYEISNYAKEGYECKHNIIYWTDEEYIGVGAGAHSYFDNKRFNNTADVREYIKNINCTKTARENIEQIDEATHISEYIILGLRMNKGISVLEFKNKFKIDINDIFKKEIDKLLLEGLIEKKGENIRLTEKGRDLSNLVFVNFLK
ncbi:MAG: radical SAM family heme chaperone HemW [Clostridiales bacterium]|nr:radical SAM family heme chaperone HemW [Clostridiales bacterium]